jgi:hypothetical protein
VEPSKKRKASRGGGRIELKKYKTKKLRKPKVKEGCVYTEVGRERSKERGERSEERGEWKEERGERREEKEEGKSRCRAKPSGGLRTQ